MSTQIKYLENLISISIKLGIDISMESHDYSHERLIENSKKFFLAYNTQFFIILTERLIFNKLYNDLHDFNNDEKVKDSRKNIYKKNKDLIIKIFVNQMIELITNDYDKVAGEKAQDKPDWVLTTHKEIFNASSALHGFLS